MKKELYQFDKEAALPLRGVLVLLVILGHSFSAMGLGRFSLATPAVSVFFFLSGYGLMRKRLSDKGEAMRGGFRRACFKLIPTFVLASAVYWIVQEACFGAKINLMQNILHGNSNLPIPFTWYVPAILSLYGIFYLLDKMCRHDFTMLLMIFIGVIGYWVLTALIFRWPFYWWKTIFGFVAGAIFAANESWIRGRLRSNMSGSCVIAMIVLAIAYCLHTRDCYVVRFLGDQLYYALIGPIVALGLFLVHLPAIFAGIGRWSYEMYVVHGAFVCWFAPMFDAKFWYVVVVLGVTIAVAGVLKALVRSCKMYAARKDHIACSGRIHE